ncbi:TPA: tetratricopeptide repeat protein [Legionella pneumophila]|uniref:tetratricopeptide repeat protein n=1 Tax=Legionella pneumophila TaxID=446 RepID=UPI000770AEA4|nr:tetratricopeptide repeat protein [Legionella pneumophila]MDW8853240.1 tetratricopeptide repeat protein [Legionella pneumophila]MDW8920529.1 tetratricopeptide repeat protein [Legionella pneumophila]MDW8926727.1 tetratricopeptide repeat protein [Legionella pneumophila]MDX1864557.1 tetratricopeptide repeat protein [Legionella pneumophila]CZH87006.1 Tetratricopeptide repeat [Legionella pneumophila]
MIKTKTIQQLVRLTHHYFGKKKIQISTIEETSIPTTITPFMNLSSDPKNWTEQVNLFLQTSSPESYVNAMHSGRLDGHIKFIINLAKKKFDSDLKMGLTQDEAIKNIKQFFLTKSTPILPTPQELIECLRNAKPLSVKHFEDLSLRYSLLPPEEKFNFIYNLMTAILENPSFAVLLTKTAFVYRFARQELYLYCLGAYFFGISNLAKATEIFKEGVTLFSTSIFYLCLANCYRAQGEWEKAKNIYVESLEKYPTDERLRSCFAGTAFAMGDTPLANSLYTPSKLHNTDLMEMRNKELQQAIASNQLYRDEEMDIYDDDFANTTWWNYWYHFNTYTRHQNGEGILADIVPEYLDKIFLKLPSPPKTFIELGTMCGEIIYRMASLYPQTTFFGIDRNQNIKNLNDEAYSLPNLEFAATDIFEFMENKKDKIINGMLFHVRTSPFLFPAFLEHLYNTAGSLGCKYIALYEAYPSSYTNKRFQRFEDMDSIAEIRGGGLIHHNYPTVLKKAGFNIIHQEIIPPTMLFAGMENTVFIVAERVVD